MRYRALYPLQTYSQRYGIGYELVIPRYSLKGIWHFIKAYTAALFHSRHSSVIVIQRINSNFIYARMLKLLVRLKQNTIFDLDDADYLEQDPQTLYYFAKHCQKITAGSTLIAKHLERHNPNTVFNTSPIIDLGIIKQKRSSIFTIGWVGNFGGGHRSSMVELVFPALLKLNFPFKLVLMGVPLTRDHSFIRDYFKDCPNIQIHIPKIADWDDEESIQRQIAQFDIGVATLATDELSLSKSGIKAKQYLNNGVPVLTNPIGENHWVIRDGINGYHCHSPKDFTQRFHEFYQMDNQKYWQFSEQARESIKYFDHKLYQQHLLGNNHSFFRVHQLTQ